MKITKIEIISIRVVISFTVAILLTFIPEHLHDFFGDWQCTKGWSYSSNNNCLYNNNTHEVGAWHWGIRHWLWSIMNIILAWIQIFKIIEIADKN